jgi:hypothetical protein
LLVTRGYAEFAEEFAGVSFGGGLYRFHDDESGPLGLRLLIDTFPEFAARACPFGYDWLGRQFAVDSARKESGQPQVLLFEPGTGEALEIPLSFAAFHDVELIHHAEAALAVEFFEAWTVVNGGLSLQRDQCVGYKVPLFLGGQDEIENLEVIDLDVYWSICGQLRRRAMSLPRGTSIKGVAGREMCQSGRIAAVGDPRAGQAAGFERVPGDPF